MEITKLTAERRAAHGTREARRVRNRGLLPGIIYGHGEEPEYVSVSAEEFRYLLEHGQHLLDLHVGSASQQVLIKDVQYDHRGATPVHVDFARVSLTERVTVAVPLEFRGTPVGTHEGGVLDHGLVDLEVECLVTEIPASIRVNVVNMKLGDIMHVRVLELPANVTAKTPAEAIVCSVRAKTAAAEVEETAPAAEGPAEPEIITRKEKEEEKTEDKK